MSAVDHALAELAAGRPVVLAQGLRPGDEGDLLVSAQLVDTATMAFLVRHTSGFLAVALPQEACDRLALVPQLPSGGGERVTVDAVGTGTGISAAARARTAQVLADPEASSVDLQRPGHVLPLAVRAGGVLSRPGRAEAAVDLTRLAGLAAGGVLGEVVGTDDPTRMAVGAELRAFARRHGLAHVTIDELVAHRMRHESVVERIVDTRLPVSRASLRAVGYRMPDGTEQVGFVGDRGLGDGASVVVHRECVPGEVFGARSCSCRADLDSALDALARSGGAVVYLRDDAGGHSLLRSRCGTPLTERERAIANAVVRDLRSSATVSVGHASSRVA